MRLAQRCAHRESPAYLKVMGVYWVLVQKVGRVINIKHEGVPSLAVRIFLRKVSCLC